MFRRKWEVVYDNFYSKGNDAGLHLFFSKRSAESWVRMAQGFTGYFSDYDPRLKIRWYTRRRGEI